MHFLTSSYCSSLCGLIFVNIFFSNDLVLPEALNYKSMQKSFIFTSFHKQGKSMYSNRASYVVSSAIQKLIIASRQCFLLYSSQGRWGIGCLLCYSIICFKCYTIDGVRTFPKPDDQISVICAQELVFKDWFHSNDWNYLHLFPQKVIFPDSSIGFQISTANPGALVHMQF